MRRGEIRLYRFAAPDKECPVLILTRDAVFEALNEIPLRASTVAAGSARQ